MPAPPGTGHTTCPACCSSVPSWVGFWLYTLYCAQVPCCAGPYTGLPPVPLPLYMVLLDSTFLHLFAGLPCSSYFYIALGFLHTGPLPTVPDSSSALYCPILSGSTTSLCGSIWTGGRGGLPLKPSQCLVEEYAHTPFPAQGFSLCPLGFTVPSFVPVTCRAAWLVTTHATVCWFTVYALHLRWTAHSVTLAVARHACCLTARTCRTTLNTTVDLVPCHCWFGLLPVHHLTPFAPFAVYHLPYTTLRHAPAAHRPSHSYATPYPTVRISHTPPYAHYRPALPRAPAPTLPLRYTRLPTPHIRTYRYAPNTCLPFPSSPPPTYLRAFTLYLAHYSPADTAF